MPVSSYGHPGIYVTEKLLGPTPKPPTTSPSVACFVGEHWRGPYGYTIQCNSWNDFVTYYGGFNSNTTPVLTNSFLPYSVFEFFANGGQTAWIQRIVQSANPGTAARALILDTQATPQAAFTLTAGILGANIGNSAPANTTNSGTWGNNLYAQVIPNGTNRFNLKIYYGAPNVNSLTNQYLVESWLDLSTTPTDPRYVITMLNSPYQGSVWVVATLGSGNPPAPNVWPNPSNQVANYQFGNGADALTPPANSDYINLFTYSNTGAAGTYVPSPLDGISGVCNFNIPGMTNTSVLTAAINYVTTGTGKPDSFLVIDTPQAQTPAGAVSYFTSLTPDSANAAVYYPWLNSPNPASSNLQNMITLPPGGFVLGQYANIDSTLGVWHAPAGLATQLANVISAERTFTPTDLDTLNTNNVNALRTRENGSVVIWGTRTMQTGYATLYVPVRRFLNYLEASLSTLLSFAVFQPNDAQLWTQITATCNSFLSGLFSQGAFPGRTAATSFYVTCDDTNNTPQTISQGVVNTTVGVALLYPAEFVALNIAQFQSSGTTTVTAQVSTSNQ